MITFSDGTQYEDESSVALGLSVPKEEESAPKVKVAEYDTKLSSDEEPKFQEWKSTYAPKDSGEDYDLRGAYKAGLTPDVETGHWPDTFKKPNHPTFSDESMYAKDAPEKAGHWEGEKFIPPITTQQQQDAIDFPKERGIFNILTGADGQKRYQLLPEKMAIESVQKLGRSFGIVKDIMEGKRVASDEEGVGAVTNIVSALATNGLMSAPFRTGTAGVFGGAIGANRIPKMFNLRDDAMEMMARGETTEDVFSKTGWYKDSKDSKWKFEISDKDAKLEWRPKSIEQLGFKIEKADNLTDVLHHPVLFDIYPELKDVKVVHDSSVQGAKFLRARGSMPDMILLGNEYSNPTSQSTGVLLHEIQHWIQNKEGWPYRGANPEQFRIPVPEDILKQIRDLTNKVTTKQASPEEIKQLQGFAKQLTDIKLYDDSQSYLNYRQNPGEIEAFNVERRYQLDRADMLGSNPVRPSPLTTEIK